MTTELAIEALNGLSDDEAVEAFKRLDKIGEEAKWATAKLTYERTKPRGNFTRKEWKDRVGKSQKYVDTLIGMWKRWGEISLRPPFGKAYQMISEGCDTYEEAKQKKDRNRVAKRVRELLSSVDETVIAEVFSDYLERSPMQISADDAEEFTQSLGQIVGGSWKQIALAERLGVPKALGLSTQDWVQQRLGGYIRLTVEERREAVKELTAPVEEGGQGMNQREAAEAVGVDPKTITNDLRAMENSTKTVDNPAESVENSTPKKNGAHVGKNSGDNEWYTPVEYVKAATAAMGGIDLDPASSEAANAVIGATTFYTAEDDGLAQPWYGRVWMNPPYAQPLVDHFCTRLAREYDKGKGNVTEACILVNNATETKWFQEVLVQCSALCLPRGRIKFWHPDKEATPLQGQAVIYLGSHVDQFKTEFLRFGPVGVF